MANTTQLDIALDLQTTLRSMTIAGGYNFDVISGSVTLDPTVNVFTHAARSKLPLFVIQASTADEPEFQPADQLVEELDWVILGVHDATDRLDQASKLTLFTQLVGDVETVLQVDPTRGGKATHTTIGKRSMYPESGGVRVMAAIEIKTRVYRTHGVP